MPRISGYGQTGPMRDLAGFGVVAQAIGGFRYITGMPGEAPVRPGISIGDSLSALHGVIGILLALYQREENGGHGFVKQLSEEAIAGLKPTALSYVERRGVFKNKLVAIG